MLSPCMTALGVISNFMPRVEGQMSRRLCVHGGNEHELHFSVSVLCSHIISRLEASLRLVPHDLSIMFKAGHITVVIMVPTPCVCVFTTAQMFLTSCQMQEVKYL